MKPGTKRLVIAAAVILVLFLVVGQPTQSADTVRTVFGMVQDGAQSLGTFIRSLIA